jgi:hypothetical protein
MTSLALTADEAKKEYGDCCVSPDADSLPKYPYGLTLYLDDDTLKKLGITDLPKVGTSIPATITVMVTGTSQRATQSSKEGETMRTCVDLQITDMEMTMPAKSAADVLYGAQ